MTAAFSIFHFPFSIFHSPFSIPPFLHSSIPPFLHSSIPPQPTGIFRTWVTAFGSRGGAGTRRGRDESHRLASISTRGMSGRSRSSSVPQAHCAPRAAETASSCGTLTSTPLASENHREKAWFPPRAEPSGVRSTIESASFQTDETHRASENRASRTRFQSQTAPNPNLLDAHSAGSEHAGKKSQPLSPACKPLLRAKIRGVPLALANPQPANRAPTRFRNEAD